LRVNALCPRLIEVCEKILSVCRGLASECDNPIIKREIFDIYVNGVYTLLLISNEEEHPFVLIEVA
jgi:hypothetical protein